MSAKHRLDWNEWKGLARCTACHWVKGASDADHAAVLHSAAHQDRTEGGGESQVVHWVNGMPCQCPGTDGGAA